MTARYYYSAKLLEDRGACPSWMRRFREVFGHGEVPLDLAFCKKLLAHKFPVYWPATRLPTREYYCALISATDPAEVLHLLTKVAELHEQARKRDGK